MSCACCRVEELRSKEVVCIKDGSCLGYVCDVEVDTCSGKLDSIVIFGRPRCFGLLGRDEDIVIPWCEIDVIGEDTILVGYDRHHYRRAVRSGGFFASLFGGRKR